MRTTGRHGLTRSALLAASLACGAILSCAWAADTAQPPAAARTPAPAGAAKPHPGTSPFTPDRFAGRAGLNYRLIWGIDSIGVRLVESGELVRFTYRVVDPVKAQVLNDKQAEAKMDDPKAGVSLVVPTMEKVGQLRQTTAPEAGRSYWMTFSNKGRRVARGDRVDVVIGSFRANNLVVD
jgi:hypothetical protein